MSNSLEDMLDELDPLYEAAMDSQNRMNAMEKEATEFINALVLKYYPEIHNLEKEGFDKLRDTIWRMLYNFVIDVDNIVNGMQIKK
ncbi:MAG: hypothetical protein M1480_04535 [Bacteroidetes bacterium]|nr:hypothetical protein [Bacteroidota bacterium]